MKTSVKETSIDAYDNLKANKELGRMQLNILNAMKDLTVYTRKQLAKELDMETSTIAGRVNELIGQGYIDVIGKKICPISSKNVEAIIKINKD
jgi:hypothetical protein